MSPAPRSLRAPEVAAGLWFSIPLLALLVARPSGVSPALVAAWLVLVPSLATLRRPGANDLLTSILLDYTLAVATAAVALACVAGLVQLDGLPGSIRAGLFVFGLLLGGGCVLGAAVCGLLWLAFSIEIAELPGATRQVEVARVAHVAAPWIAAALLGSAAVPSDLAGTSLVLVPAPLAVALTLSGFVLLLALWLRLRAHRAGAAE